ncbi:hypothetical protein ACPPVV_17655 [Rhodanobacter sp. Col0626]|uniref:hypothetical protein n=1 Tax=Rhodanobacter sp. Col0626 TaxID=3415679 RepID=UPI003CEEA460
MIVLVLTLLLLLAIAAIPIVFAQRKHVLFVSDLGLLLLPTIAFVFSAIFLRKEDVGFGLLRYPFMVFFASEALLWVRVFILDRFSLKARACSIVLLLLACLGAVTLGILVPHVGQ